MLLVKFNNNWADEFDVHGMALMNLEAYKSLMKWAKNATWSFGTNEGWEEEDITDAFSMEYVDDLELDILQRFVFGNSNTYGIFPDWREQVYNDLFDAHEIRENERGFSIWFENNVIAFGFRTAYEANECLHSRIEGMI